MSNSKRSQVVRASEQKFIDQGGTSKLVRLTPKDQANIREIELRYGIQNSSEIIRLGLQHLRDSLYRSEKDFQPIGDGGMKIIAVVNQKGGAGKTTTAQAIADCLAHRGYKVVLLDTDKQQSSQNFKLRRDEHHPDLPQIAVYTVGSKFSSESLRAHFGSFDYIIIDGPGGRDNHIDSMTICAVCSADLVLLPLKTSTHDVDQTLLTINRIKERQQITGGSPLTRAIITAAVPAKKTYKAVLEFLDGQELVKMRNDLTNRTLHEALPAEGLSAIYSGDKRAVQEINEITDEVESYFVKTK